MSDIGDVGLVLNDFEKEIKEKDYKLKVLERALEDLSYYLEFDYGKKQDDIWYRKSKDIMMYFISQAEMKLKKEEN